MMCAGEILDHQGTKVTKVHEEFFVHLCVLSAFAVQKNHDK